MPLEPLQQQLSQPQSADDARLIRNAVPQSRGEYDLAIVGGGIVGLTLASALKSSGLRIALIEAKPHSVAASKGQAYAVSLLSGQILRGIGVWEKILPQITTFRQIRLSDANWPQIARFLSQDLGTDALGYVAEHQVLLQALQESIQGCLTTIHWFCPAEVLAVTYGSKRADLAIEVAGERHHLRTRLVVAADGVRSRLRQQAGIGTHGWPYWQSCIVATVKPEKPHQDIAYERFWPSGPFAILPLPDNRCRIVWTAPHAEAQSLCELDDETFLAELSRRYGDQMGRLALMGDRFVFPVQLMHSDRYARPRLALIGDAAHCCHPVGGQGLNLGIRDAAALAQVIQAAGENQEDIGSLAVLQRYERWRRRENWTILGMTDFLDRCFSNNWLPLVVLRRSGLWLLSTVQVFKVIALQLMTGLSGQPPHLARGQHEVHPEGRSPVVET